jgi:hypothetical protein
MAMAGIQLTPGVADADDRLLDILIAETHSLAEGPSDKGAEAVVTIRREPPPNSFHRHRMISFLPKSLALQ